MLTQFCDKKLEKANKMVKATAQSLKAENKLRRDDYIDLLD